jgi:hypothetical protein
MAAYQSFTTARATEPDTPALLATLRSVDPSAGLAHLPGTATYVVKKDTAWTAPQITTVQTLIDTAPEATPALSAQAWVDAMPLYEKALVLALVDQLNVLRARASLAAITPAAAMQAIRDKAGTL